MVSTLAMTNALAKLLIEKGVSTDAEFKQKLLEERAVYQRILEPQERSDRSGETKAATCLDASSLFGEPNTREHVFGFSIDGTNWLQCVRAIPMSVSYCASSRRGRQSSSWIIVNSGNPTRFGHASSGRYFSNSSHCEERRQMVI
jgi:hypothetical protein